MAGRDVLGYHCARLHKDDQESILRDGLRPLSLDHLRERIAARVAIGDLPADVGDRLIAENQAGDANRAGMIWLIFTRGPIQDGPAVIRLLSSWGGEALYNSHERDAITGPLLKSIGEACIVEARVPLDQVKHFSEIGERMRRGFLLRRGIKCDNPAEMEGYIRAPLAAHRINTIHRRRDASFEALTRCSTWRVRLLGFWSSEQGQVFRDRRLVEQLSGRTSARRRLDPGSRLPTVGCLSGCIDGCHPC